jgi:transglutaminase-like putative cysteine protease
MPTALRVRHTTTYQYAAPVSFGEHRLMLRPRDSHDMRLVGATLTTSTPAELRWIHDVFSNSIAIAKFSGEDTELKIESELVLERYALDRPPVELDPSAERYPFIYSADERADLGRLLELHYPDTSGELRAWAQSFVVGPTTDTLALLSDINQGIRSGFSYAARDAEGTQTPLETIRLGTGSCRDFAFLMVEALRALGFATRFVSGYLYDPALDGGASDGTIGSGATHAWLDVYLPGAGWVEYDPTNGLVGSSSSLIRVAVARDPSQAVPIAGSFVGRAGDYLGMSVDVQVTTAIDGESPTFPTNSIPAAA